MSFTSHPSKRLPLHELARDAVATRGAQAPGHDRARVGCFAELDGGQLLEPRAQRYCGGGVGLRTTVTWTRVTRDSMFSPEMSMSISNAFTSAGIIARV